MKELRPVRYEEDVTMKTTVGEKIKKLNPEQIVALKNAYGVFWIGKAKFVFGALSYNGWNSTETEVIIHNN